MILSFLVEDLYKLMFRCLVFDKELVFLGCMVVFVIFVIVLFFVWEKNNIIFGLVSYVWVGFGVLFGLVVLFSLFWK